MQALLEHKTQFLDRGAVIVLCAIGQHELEVIIQSLVTCVHMREQGQVSLVPAACRGGGHKIKPSRWGWEIMVAGAIKDLPWPESCTRACVRLIQIYYLKRCVMPISNVTHSDRSSNRMGVVWIERQVHGLVK